MRQDNHALLIVSDNEKAGDESAKCTIDDVRWKSHAFLQVRRVKLTTKRLAALIEMDEINVPIALSAFRDGDQGPSKVTKTELDADECPLTLRQKSSMHSMLVAGAG